MDPLNESTLQDPLEQQAGEAPTSGATGAGADANLWGGIREWFGDTIDWITTQLLGAGIELQPDGTIRTRHGEVGPFLGDWEGRSRAEIIAERLADADLAAATAVCEGPARWAVHAGGESLFQITPEDARNAGYLDPRLAAHTWAAALSGDPLDTAALDSESPTDLDLNENAALLAFQPGIEVGSDDTVLAYGVRLGPFVGMCTEGKRSEVIARRLSSITSSDFRDAEASADQVTVGTTRFSVTADDARAQGAESVDDAAQRQAALLDGTWVKGAYDTPGRRVMPRSMSDAALFEFARMVAEGPGHTSVSLDPGQVTVVGIRGVSLDGVYDPKLLAQDDIVIPLVVDADGARRAIKLSGTVDPGGHAGGATQVGDAAQSFYYSNEAYNRNLAGTGLLKPGGSGIEGKDSDHGVQDFDEVETAARDQYATFIHFGTSAEQSRGCTVIVDEGQYYANMAELTALYDSGAHELDAAVRGADAAELAVLLEQAEPGSARAQQLTRLLELRSMEAATAAANRGDDSVAAQDLGSVPNYKSFLSMVYRDPDLRVTYVIVDGSKVPELKLV